MCVNLTGDTKIVKEKYVKEYWKTLLRKNQNGGLGVSQGLKYSIRIRKSSRAKTSLDSHPNGAPSLRVLEGV